jgi:hypothetical protein
MRPGDPTVIHESLFQGLADLVHRTKMSCILTGLYEECFPDWLRLYCQQLDFFSINQIQIGNNSHYDSILRMLSVSVENSN